MGAEENSPPQVVLFDSSRSGSILHVAATAARDVGWVVLPYDSVDYARAEMNLSIQALIATFGLGWDSITGSPGFPLIQKSNQLHIPRAMITDNIKEASAYKRIKIPDILVISNDPELPAKLSKWLVGLVAKVE